MRFRLEAIESAFAGLCANASLVEWWPVRIVLLVITGGAVAVLIAMWRRHIARLVALAVVIVLATANFASALNAYYGYYLTIGQALGLAGEDQGSLAALNAQKAPPASGFVATVSIPGRRSGFAARPAEVYLPPAWFGHPRPKLPVVVLLHGTPGSPSDWLDAGAAAASADHWAATHRGVTPILVMPDINGSELGDTECVDGPQGQAETYLSTDVPGFVQARFDTRPPGRQWAVAGLSEGGSCSIMLALRHPAVYGAFADYGGLLGPRIGDTNDPGDTAAALFSGSAADFAAHEPSRLLGARRHPPLQGLFVVGENDSEPLVATRILARLCQDNAIPARTVIIPGGEHTFDVWRQGFALSLPWFADRFGLTGRPAAPATAMSTVEGSAGRPAARVN